MDGPVQGAHAFGQGDFADGLPGSRPERVEGLERRPELDSGLGLGPIEGRHVSGGQASANPVENHGSRRHLAGRGLGDLGLGMQRPVVLAVALAEDLDVLRRRPLRRGHDDLHLASARRRFFLRRVLRRCRKNQRIAHLQVFDDRRPGTLRKADGSGHRTVQGTGREDVVEHAVVVHPRRVRDVEFGLEIDLAAG